MKPLTIIHINSNNTWGGGERYILDLAKEQMAHGHRVLAVTRGVDVIVDTFTREGLDVKVMPLKGYVDLLSSWRLARIIRGIEGTVVVNTHNFNDTFIALRTKHIVGGGRVRVVCCRHLVRPAKLTRRFAKLYSGVDAIVFDSEAGCREFLSSDPPIDTAKAVPVLNSIIPPANLHQSAPKHPGWVTVMYHGRVVHEKGAAIPVKAMALLSDLPVRLVVAGGGDKEYIEALHDIARRDGTADRITFTGYVDDVHPLIEAADIGVVPSLVKESCGLANLEYMSHGKPVITTDTGGQKECVTHGQSGYVIPPDDPAALAAAVRNLASDPERLRLFSQNALQEFGQRLHYPRFYNQIMEVYERIV